MNAPEYNDKWCIMTKSRSFWSAWGNSEYKRIFELSAGIYGFPYYRKGMDKTQKAASEQSDAAVLGMFVLLLINTIPGAVPEAKLPPGLPVTIPRTTDTSSIRNVTVPAAILIPRQRVRESIRLGFFLYR